MGTVERGAREYGLDKHYVWARPPVGGWVADDLDLLPNLPRRTELIDGNLVFVCPQTNFHARTLRADADTGPRQTWLQPEDVVLAAEVVAEDTEERDREVKPRKYAKAGIRHHWRVEEKGGLPVVYVYELDPANRTYVPTGIHHDKLRLTVPFPIDIDLTAIDRRR